MNIPEQPKELPEGTLCTLCQKVIGKNEAFVCGPADPSNPKSVQAFHTACFLKQTCAACGQPLGSGNILGAMGKQFHIECFVCHQCNKKLTSSYSVKEDKPYCSDCVANLVKQAAEAKTCVGCKKPLAGGKALQINGELWHLECFTCESCNVILTTGCYKVDNKRYCKRCVEDLEKQQREKMGASTKQSQPATTPAASEAVASGPSNPQPASKTCHACSKPITSGQVVSVLGRLWHPSCFACFKCKKAIEGGKLAAIENEPHCLACAEAIHSEKWKQEQQQKQAQQGGGIGSGSSLVVEETEVREKGAPGQVSSVTCTICQESISGDYMELADKAYCPSCAELVQKGTVCNACRKPIREGAFRKVADKFWHQNCFKCYHCKKPIEEQYSDHEKHFYCLDCHHELFGVFKTNCFACNKRITGTTEVVEHNGRAFHKTCFVCARCKEEFPKGEFMPGKSGALYCKKCFYKIVQNQA